MTDRRLCVSSSYSSLASQATLTDENPAGLPSTSTSTKLSDPEVDINQTTPTTASNASVTATAEEATYNDTSWNNRESFIEAEQEQAPRSPLTTDYTSCRSDLYQSERRNNHGFVGIYNATADGLNKTIDKVTIPIRNNLPIAAAVENKVMGAHHHRHRSLIHHYSPLVYVPTHRPKFKDDECTTAAFTTSTSPTITTASANFSCTRKASIRPSAATVATGESVATIAATAKTTAAGPTSTAAYPRIMMPHQITRAKKERLVVLLGECLLKSGCPGHRAEEALQHSASILGLTNASFSLLPETVLVTFMSDGGNKHQQSLMIKSPTSLDMGKIGQVHQIMNRCLIQQANTKKDVDDRHRNDDNEGYDDSDEDDDVLDQCIQALQHVSNSPPTWGFLGTLFSFFVSSFTACAMLFDGSWIDCILSGILGLVVAVLFVLASCRPIYGRVFEISACVFVSALAQALHAYCCFTSVAVSGVLNLLPGYAMTMAVMELSARRVTTGTIRLIYAVFYAFLLAYGFQIGSRAYTSIAEALKSTTASSNPPEEQSDDLCGQNPISQWFYIPMLPLLSISIGMSYGSSIRQSYAQLGGAIIGFCLCYFMNKIVSDPPIVESTAAFAVGLYSHFVLKLTGEPPLISMAVGITLLVPGSIGVKGAYALLHQEDTSQMLFPIKMLTVALGLAAGLFASAMIVYPTGKRRTLLLSF